VPQTCLGSVIPPCRVWSQRRLIALLVGLALSVGLSLRAQAATTWTVCASGCDYASIKSAIAAPTTLDGDTLVIAAGTYTEPGIVVNKSLTLQGERAATTIVQAAASKGTATDRVFTIASGITVTLRALTIRNGHADRGGGLYNEGTLTLTHSTVRHNAARYGGGLYNGYGSRLTLTASTVSGNSAEESGGGFFNSMSTMTVTNSTVRDNTAGLEGGGFDNGGTLTLTASTISHNTAPHGWAGGLVNYSTLTLTASTVSHNAANFDGGGLYNWGTLTLTASTVSGNTAAIYDGGGLVNNEGTLTLTQSIVAKNPDGGDCHIVSGSITSDGYNLDSDGSCQLTATTDRPGVDPLLGPLQDNGGPTFTQALLPGSPAIDAISWGTNGCGTTRYSDQRGQARPQPTGGACDIGAYEVAVDGQPLSAWVTGVTLRTAVCQNLATGHEVTLSAPVSPWNCEAAGLGVTPGDQVALRARGPVQKNATDVGGAVAGVTPQRGTCTNVTTGQQVTLHYMRGATAASCLAAGLVVQAGEAVQLRVQGVAE
jgi:hypothetical protein